jgi:hypothetical protein
MRRAASANAKLEALFWKSEAAFPFERYLTRMNEAFKELEDAGQPMYVQQKVQFLLRSMRCDDIQVQTTMGIVRDRYLNDFDAACMTLSRTVSSRFALAEPGKSNKRSIGAATTNNKDNRGSGGSGGGRSGNCGRGSGGSGKMKVVMNGVDVSDINRNFTSDEWEKLRTCGGIAYIHQRREYLANRGSGRFDGRGGGSGRGSGRGYGDRGPYGRSGGRGYATDKNRSNDQLRSIAATAANTSTEIVEYDADASNVAPARAPASGGDRVGRAGARFGPRRDY